MELSEDVEQYQAMFFGTLPIHAADLEQLPCFQLCLTVREKHISYTSNKKKDLSWCKTMNCFYLYMFQQLGM